MTAEDEVMRRAMAAAEERLAAREHDVQERLHALADRFPDPQQAHDSASALSARADRHLARAEELRGA
ncbi:hypothetical protein [Motilibacter aurantiacus]|uniref:hypothetical protein n=1 Tax=Motilibacter aurantiacus TaxID=2714955 RepID=UPI00140E74D6|nr:hypothetical protein [Motilibacter aurantiacus]NHC46464.1 hypothetical protein [Motilibacter aurantiacus]